jgi:hypothetical protein
VQKVSPKRRLTSHEEDWLPLLWPPDARSALANAVGGDAFLLSHEDFGITMELCAQSEMGSMRDAQGKFLEQSMGDRIHLLTERVL